MLKSAFFLLCMSGAGQIFCQSKIYTSQNIHSHNDYKQQYPFYTAYNAEVGSMEADIYLKENSLLVAHTPDELNPTNTLEHLYLEKLDSCINANKGFPYADKNKKLQLLIDLKTYGPTLLDSLAEHFKKFPSIIGNKNITITITGIDHNFSNPSDFAKYPDFIHFDGVLSEHYPPEAQKKIAMYSDDFMKYVSWRSDGALEVNIVLMKKEVSRVHRQGKTFRLWGGPDNPISWQTFKEIGVDYINTDHIDEAAKFLNNDESP